MPKQDVMKVKFKIEDLLNDKMDEIKEFKAKQKGDITPRSLLVVLLNELCSDDIEELVVIRKYKNGDISTGWTTENAVESLGMAEVLKLHVADEI